MTKLNLQSIFEEVRFNSFVNSLLHMNEEEIVNVVSDLNEETKTRIITVLEAKLPKPRVPKPKAPKLDAPDAKVEVNPEIRRNQQVIDIIKKSGGEASPELKADATAPVPKKTAAKKKPNDDVNPAPRPATDIEPGSLRDKWAKGPPAKADAAVPPRPATDIAPGSMRDQWAKGAPTKVDGKKDVDLVPGESIKDYMKRFNDANPSTPKTKQADAAFNDVSKAIGARKAAEKTASAIDMPKNNLGNISRNKTMDSNVKKVAAGLAGAGVLGGTAALIAANRDNTPKSQAEPPAAAPSAPATSNLKPATVIPDKPKFEFGSKKGGIVSAAELNKYRDYSGNKNVTLGQYMNARDNLTAKSGGANDPQQIMKSKNIKSTDVYRPEQIKAGKAQRGRPTMAESLIDAFMKLQNDTTGNIFEAAKKAKKDWDKDGKIESSKDEVWGSRFKAAKAAGKMQEESEAEKAKKKSMSHELDAPSSGGKAPEMTSDPDWLKKKESKVVKTGKNTSTAYKVDEEIGVEFSKAELAHIAAIVEGNPMAPVPDDYSGAAGGVSKRDLSDETVAENKKMSRIDMIKARLKNKK